MFNYRYLFISLLLWSGWLGLPKAQSRDILQSDFSVNKIPGLQSQTVNSVIVDDAHFIWISNSNGIDCYDGLETYHYKLSDLGKRGFRDGMMIQLYKDSKNRIWAYTERGNIYCFDPQKDKFYTAVDLYSMEKYYSVQALYVTADDILVVGMNNGVLCYDLNQKKLLSHEIESANVRCILPIDGNLLLVGSDMGIHYLDLTTGNVTASDFLGKPVQSMLVLNRILWVATNGRGLLYMPLDALGSTSLIQDSEDIIFNELAYHEKYGLILATDGQGLMQLSLDGDLHASVLRKVAYDSQDSMFPTRSGGINGVMVDQGNIWFTMHMGGCICLVQNHSLFTLTNPEAVSPSDNFVYDLDFGPDGGLWVAFNQSIVHYDANGGNPETFMNRESRFLTIKMRPDTTFWTGGYGTGLYHFDPKTGKKEWYPSVCDSPYNDNIYDIHDTPEGDLWIGGLNMPLTHLHFKPNGLFETTRYEETRQVFDVESLNADTLVLGTTDGFWLLNKKTGQMSHHLQVGAEYEWNGSNLVRSLITRNGNEVWAGTAGGGLVCYDVHKDQYEYFDSLAWLPSLEIRSVLMLNDSILCASTESNGVFSFNCNRRQVERIIFTEDEMLQQEFLQNAGTRTGNGDLFFGGNRGGIRITPHDIETKQLDYWISIMGPKENDGNFELSYKNRTLSIHACVNDIYHQEEYQFLYRIPGYVDEWLPFTDGRRLHLMNLPYGTWKLELRAVDATKFELNKVCTITVSTPIWQRWYAWVFYVYLVIYLVLKIVIHRLRPRLEDM